MNIKEILTKGTNRPVEENHFIKPPKLPYIIFIREENVRGVKDDNLIIDSDISIELYSEKIDTNLENTIRNIIINKILKVSNNDDEFEINQNRDYIESEQMWLSTFDFNLVEKGGE